jgi:hypothetical protein
VVRKPVNHELSLVWPGCDGFWVVLVGCGSRTVFVLKCTGRLILMLVRPGKPNGAGDNCWKSKRNQDPSVARSNVLFIVDVGLTQHGFVLARSVRMTLFWMTLFLMALFLMATFSPGWHCCR